jgi:hypothetical protein
MTGKQETKRKPRDVLFHEMIEYFRLNIEYLRSTYGGSILNDLSNILTERSDFHKSSIFNLQFRLVQTRLLNMNIVHIVAKSMLTVQ